MMKGARHPGLVILFLLLFCAGAAGVWLHFQKAKTVSVPILMYHRIGDTYDSPWWVTVRDFENQLQCLKEQGYRSIFPSDLVAHQRWGWPLPAKPIIITFDDGYLNVLENAEPLLKKYGFHAVSYLITGAVSESPETRKTWEGTPLLSWPEVRAMSKRGTIRFGGHSRNHPNLRALADPLSEITGCYRDLKKKGGLTPEGFCYPSGQFKEETLACVARAKFTTAVTCEDGIATIGRGTNLLTLPRVAVMGGWHGFHVEIRQGEGPGMIVDVSKEGHPLEFSPRWVTRKGMAFAQDGWLPPVELSTKPTRLFWKNTEQIRFEAPVLELWDNFHVIRFLHYPLANPLQ